MSLTANYIGTLQEPEFFSFSSTAKVDVFPVPTTNKGLTLADYAFVNNNGSAQECKLYYDDGSTEYLAWVGSVAAKTAEPTEAKPIRLKPGSTLRAEVASASGITLHMNLVSQLETTR